MDRPIFFCHIPKTAGTSVRTAIEANIKPWQIMPDHYMMQRNGGLYPPIDVIYRAMPDCQQHVRLLRGHYFYSARHLLSGAATVVVLRDPVQRVVSYLKHIVRNGAEVETIYAELERENFPPAWSNLMTQYMGSPLLQSHGEKKARGNYNPDTLLKQALHALETVDVLGLTERMDLFEAQLSTLLGKPLKLGVKNSGEKTKLDLTDDHIRSIRKHNNLDLELYKKASDISLKNKI